MNELISAQTSDITIGSSTSNVSTTRQVTNAETVALAVPTNLKALESYLHYRVHQTISHYAIQLKNDGRKTKPLDDEQLTELTLTIRALSNIQGLTAPMEKVIGVKRALEVVMNDVPDTEIYQFPPPFPEMAKEIHEKYEADNWGDNDEIRDDDENDTDGDTPTPSSSTSTTKASKSSSHTLNTVIRRPHRNHLIYGTNGIMHGILVDHNSMMTTYKIDDNFPHRSAKVFDHNGMEVEQWWPRQICALRDGAHGSKTGGISGSLTYGAYSIVVSGLYADLDADYGDQLYYSGSKSHDNTDPAVPVVSDATKALQHSRLTGKVVRVLRASSGEGYLSPSVGLRYDGLFRVVLEETMKNRRGGAYLRFRLVRIVEQPPIDRSRPSMEERGDYECVRSYY